jgi:hypothetical protein
MTIWTWISTLIETWTILIWRDNLYHAEGDSFLKGTETLKPNILGVFLSVLKQVNVG